jgi:hypothetical protein
VAGVEKQLRVSSLRKLAWDSMRVNFFVLTPPGVIEDAPASYITSFHLPAAQADAASALLKRFPNLTLIDVQAVVSQLQSVVGQVANAIQFVFLFALLAGAIVLYAALLTAFDERRYELAVMRALGARRRIVQALRVELAVNGALGRPVCRARALVYWEAWSAGRSFSSISTPACGCRCWRWRRRLFAGKVAGWVFAACRRRRLCWRCATCLIAASNLFGAWRTLRGELSMRR